MNPILLAGIVAIAIIALVVGSGFVNTLIDTRRDSEREQRRRIDLARQQTRSDAERDLWLSIGARAFDPLGLFHG